MCVCVCVCVCVSVCVGIGVQCKPSMQAIEWLDCVFREIGKIMFVELTDEEECLD